MPTGSLSHDKSVISIEQNGNMWINPVEFAQRVVTTIESDFKTFEGISTSRLPTEKTYQAGTSTDNGKWIVLGTNTEPKNCTALELTFSERSRMECNAIRGNPELSPTDDGVAEA